MSLDHHKTAPVEALLLTIRKKMRNLLLLPTALTILEIVVDGNHTVMSLWLIQIGLLLTKQGSKLKANGKRTLQAGIFVPSKHG